MAEKNRAPEEIARGKNGKEKNKCLQHAKQEAKKKIMPLKSLIFFLAFSPDLARGRGEKASCVHPGERKLEGSRSSSFPPRLFSDTDC